MSATHVYLDGQGCLGEQDGGLDNGANPSGQTFITLQHLVPTHLAPEGHGVCGLHVGGLVNG